MNVVFADTSYFLALLSPADVAHDRAVALSSQLRPSIVTTHWIIVELGNSLSGVNDRGLFHKWLSALRRDESATAVPASDELLDDAIELHANRLDKNWSITDCVSFVVMRERGITDALTTDRHFSQAGFQILL